VEEATLPDSTPKILIAIDGPAGAGKSTVAARLACELGLPYIDTGAMYRAVGLLALRDGLEVPFDEPSARRVARLMAEHSIDVEVDGTGTRILVDGKDVSSQIRTAEASLMASAVSALPAVRRALVPLQRELASRNGGVMEGRDIGTVVLPDADLKFFLTASAEERAVRRHRDLASENKNLSVAEVMRQQHQRDLQDTSREESPLQVAHGSTVIDTTGLGLEEVVERMLEEAARLLSRNA
jgi:cytidylate kinase